MKQYKKYFNNILIKETQNFLLEAVLHPEKYLTILETFLLKLKRYIVGRNDSAKFVCSYLSRQFKKYGIIFILDNNIKAYGVEFDHGISKGDYANDKKIDIIIYCNDNIIKIQQNKQFFDMFSIYVLKTIGHELVHRLQVLHIEDLKLREKVYSVSSDDIIKYLQNKYEIMARAWQIVEELRFRGQNDEQIKEILRNKNKAVFSFSLSEYRRLFDKDSDILKLLYKYIYLYLVENEIEII